MTDTDPTGLTLTRELSVEWGECDPLGIIFYPIYFHYFDQSSHRLFGLVGHDVASLRETYQLAGPVIVDARATFRAPVRYGDRLTARAHVDDWQDKLFRIAHRITKDGDLVCEGYEMRAWAVIDESRPAGFRAGSIPQAFRDLFSG